MTGIRQALTALWAASDDARMIQQGGHWHTWGEVRALVEQVDAALTAVGAGEGSRVGVVLENRTESIAALLAILANGRTVTALNPMQPTRRIAADLQSTGPDVVIAPENCWHDDEFAAAVETVGATAFAFDGGALRYRTVRPARDVVAADPLDPVAIEMFTSGTTGPPKRIPLTWRQLDSAMDAVHRRLASRASVREPLTGRVALVTLALVHIGGMWSVLQSLVEARPIVLLPRFTVDGWVRAVHEHELRIASLPPAAMRSVLAADVPADRLRSLRAVTAGTTVVSPDLADEFTGRYGIPVLIVYGATEFSGAVAGWTRPMHEQWWTRKRGSVGRAFPGADLRVVDDDGELPAGTTGRLEVRSGQTGSSDWVRTSDLAHIDDDGFLYIDGRADDAIVRGGFKVQPEVVAQALRSHSGVLDAAVFGRVDDRLGHVPVAVVELAGSTDPVDESSLKDFVRDQLTPYEVPVAIHTVAALPRSASLKIDRRRLLELVADREPPAHTSPDTKEPQRCPQ